MSCPSASISPPLQLEMVLLILNPRPPPPQKKKIQTLAAIFRLLLLSSPRGREEIISFLFSEVVYIFEDCYHVSVQSSLYLRKQKFLCSFLISYIS